VYIYACRLLILVASHSFFSNSVIRSSVVKDAGGGFQFLISRKV